MVAWVTFLIFNADAAGVLWPGFTLGMLMLFGMGLAGLGMWGRQRNRQGTSIDGLYLALGVREVNYRGTSIFYEQDGRRAKMNEDVLKGEWKEIKGGIKEKWGKLTDDDLTRWKEIKRNSWGFCSRNMDTQRTMPSSSCGL